ncbi:MAG: TonB-dependent receptor [Vicinamibacterales bacterium]
MIIKSRLSRQGLALVAVLGIMLLAPSGTSAQTPGAIHGRVTFAATGEPIHGAVVLLVGDGRSATTNDQGEFDMANVPAGRYEIVAQREHLTTARQPVTVMAGQPVELALQLALSPVHEELTVTGGPTGETTTFEAFNATQTFDSFDLARIAAPSLARAVQRAPGVEIRSFGPGSERPIIRGFDGDRVLMLEDNIRTGDLSSQSADHGVTLDPGALDRLEIVRGPATLLYGANAVGGLVHALTPQEAFRRTPFAGLRGQVLTDAGSGNGQAGGNANVQYGARNWLFWAGGGSRRSSDYQTPVGTVENSAADLSNARAGIGYSGRRGFASVGYSVESGRYGIPFAGTFHSHAEDEEHADDHEHDADAHGDEDAHEEEDAAHDLAVDLQPRRHTLRFDAGVRELPSGLAESARVIVSRLDWRHDEIEIESGAESLGTRFDSATTAIRAEVEQRRVGRLTGRFGVTGEFRDYLAAGEEALAPATTSNAVAAFAYEQLDFGPARLMFGGRVDRTNYNTEERDGPNIPQTGGHVHGDDGILPPATRDRAFTGGSGSAGVHVDLGRGNAVVGTLTRSYRAPALEELYNFGPHVGNLAFEIGNTNLDREATVGVDVSLRHRSTRARGEFNTFVYNIDNFVFPSASTREVIDGLFVAQYLQGDSRFAGFDGQAGIRLHDRLWANVSAGYVRATLTRTDEAVPRIPPLHGRVWLDVVARGFTLTPEIAWASRQDRLFRNETETDGYALLNLQASYMLPRGHLAHVFSISGDNLTNELYRRHTSIIKDLAPEIGRRVRVSYGIRFF